MLSPSVPTDRIAVAGDEVASSVLPRIDPTAGATIVIGHPGLTDIKGITFQRLDIRRQCLVVPVPVSSWFARFTLRILD